MKTRKHRYLGWVIALLTAVVALSVFWQRDNIYEYYRGAIYTPSGEMARIRSDLELTERGEFLFNAAQPVLNSSEEFNTHCRAGGVEVAVLGCYTEGGIYVYDITDEELEGIRELTTAHELLHVVFAKLSEEEKNILKPMLDEVYYTYKDILESELDAYTEAERFEELYVRAGTEIADLPAYLEKHYAEVFRNQDKIVAYYNSYIKVFNALKAEMDSLKAEIDALGAEYDAKVREYENFAAELDAEISYFNACADMIGCFTTESDFYLRRAILLDEQTRLEDMYTELNVLVEKYNQKVEEYNNDVLRNEQLNEKINSNAKPKEIKEENGRN